MSLPGPILSGDQVTFRELFPRFARVEVPIIQRDYAQGRASAADIRNEFLGSLHGTLTESDPNNYRTLDLDFVYGGVGDSGAKIFSPLDGQQRLTTLFLLHWYLAWLDGRQREFTAFICENKKSRFSYRIRASSEEFVDQLVQFYPESRPGTTEPSLIIADQTWFFRQWMLDPTIKSALVMLDAIHAKFKSTSGCFDRLVQDKPPYVSFQLLDLGKFGLSDDLYIKMNARGKPLTPFETFKARLEQELEQLFSAPTYKLHGKAATAKEYFSHKIDTEWADLFWHYRDEKTHLYDELFMQLFRSLVLVTRSTEPRESDQLVESLKNDSEHFSFLRYKESGCISDPQLILNLISFLDRCQGGIKGVRRYLPNNFYYDEEKAFRLIVTGGEKRTYEILIQFWAYCAFLAKATTSIDPSKFGNWMRIVGNLAVNSIAGQAEVFLRSIKSVNGLLPHAADILAHLANTTEEILGFNERQIHEERLKAQLILLNTGWEKPILKAEQHGYFLGQIEFLLKFCGVLSRWHADNQTCKWTPAEDDQFRASFNHYLNQAFRIFDESGIKDYKNYRTERALLTFGDYMLPRGRNLSFLTNTLERDASWKRLLRGGTDKTADVERKRDILQSLLDSLDENAGVEASLDRIIASGAESQDWRRLFVGRPALLAYCGNRMIRRTNNRIYLLSRQKTSAWFAELFSYDLHLGLLTEKQHRNEWNPFALCDYRFCSADADEPFAWLKFTQATGSFELHITGSFAGFELKLFYDGPALPGTLDTNLLADSLLVSTDSTSVTWTVTHNAVNPAIDEVVGRIKAFIGPRPEAQR